MISLAETGQAVTFASIFVASAIAGTVLAIKILTKLSPAWDGFFGSKQHARQKELAHLYVDRFLTATEQRPIVIKAVLKEVPAEMVLRMSTAESHIVALQSAQEKMGRDALERYERILDTLGEIKIAMADQGFKINKNLQQRQ